MNRIIACIDGSPATRGVCDYAAWASLKLGTPIHLLHVLDRKHYPADSDLSGTIGLGSREHLLDELARLDEKRRGLGLKQGQLLLEAAQEHVSKLGAQETDTLQRHGDFLDTLRDMQAQSALFVMGRLGEETPPARLIGSHLESAIRTLTRPILVTPVAFEIPQRVMLGFDNSNSARKALELMAESPLFRGLECHIVTVGKDNAENHQPLEDAATILRSVGLSAVTAIVEGDVELALEKYRKQQEIGLTVMGAYGHSRLRHFFMGSNTGNMLRTAGGALLVVR
ncbi:MULTISPECIES: universal stress protein [Pseudomonas]|uniref:universal stress protein n=1 Tax=Pseudomonas TaxID=286 RepID=UPI00289C820E|nr:MULTISPECIES: universal stress protein [Pseudomonas]